MRDYPMGYRGLGDHRIARPNLWGFFSDQTHFPVSAHPQTQRGKYITSLKHNSSDPQFKQQRVASKNSSYKAGRSLESHITRNSNMKLFPPKVLCLLLSSCSPATFFSRFPLFLHSSSLWFRKNRLDFVTQIALYSPMCPTRLF